MNNTEMTAKLNDILRTSLVGGRIVMTSGVVSLDDQTKLKVFQAVRKFNTFTPENDPYGEHDFGSVSLSGQKFFWKIDYYDRDYRFHSKNPADPNVTRRVLTIMLAEEY